MKFFKENKGIGLLYSLECFFKVEENVVNMLCADRKTDSVRLDALFNKLFFVKLGMSGGSRVDSKALYVCNVGKEREYLKVVDKLLSVVLGTLYLKGEDRAAAVREILIVKTLLLARCKRGVVNVLNLRVLAKEINYLEGVFNVSFNSQREGFKSLKEQECVERRKSCACIS